MFSLAPFINLPVASLPLPNASAVFLPAPCTFLAAPLPKPATASPAAFHQFFLPSDPPANLCAISLNKPCVCVPLSILVPLVTGIVTSRLGVMNGLPLGGITVSCLKPPGPFPRPLSPTVANVSVLIRPLLTTLLLELVVPVCILT